MKSDEIDLDYCIRNVSVQTGEEFSPQFLQNLTHRRKLHAGGGEFSQGYQQDHITSGRTIHTGKDHGTSTRILTDQSQQKRVGFECNQNEQLVYEYHHTGSRISKKGTLNSTELSNIGGGRGLQLEAEQTAYLDQNTKYHQKDCTIRGHHHHPQQSSAYTNEIYNVHAYKPYGAFSEKMKFLCSFGGRVLTRPSDGKFRYVGGETRIISVKKNLNYQELVKKTYAICNRPHIIKYQLPGEDLDALISVCSDEDFHHMIDEYNELEKGCQRLRIFLEYLNDIQSPCSSEASSIHQTDNAYKYVVAVNSIPEPCLQLYGQSNVDFKKPEVNESAIQPSRKSMVPSSILSKQQDMIKEKTQKSKCEIRSDLISNSDLMIKWMENNKYLNLGFDLNTEECQHIVSPATPLERQQSIATTISSDHYNGENPFHMNTSEESDHMNDHIIHDLLNPNSTICAPISSDVSLGESYIDNLGDVSLSQTSDEKNVDDMPNFLPHDILLSTTDFLNIQEKTIDGVLTRSHSGNESVAQSASKDVEDDKRMRDGPISDATMAEIQAGIHGLQTIRNADLEELSELGCGTFGTVYHGKWRGTDVAIKRFKESCFSGKPTEQDRLTKDFWREAQILSQLHHPNVVAFYGVVRDGPRGTLSTVTEFMANGSLRRVLSKNNRALDLRKQLIIAQDAAIGMEYLHLKNIVHFDLKCDNLLVNLGDLERPVCKVGDFGLSRIKRNSLVSGGARGTLPWIAPELLDGSSNRVSEKVDVFSFGIAMWEILTGEEPYADMHCGAIIGGIVTNTLRPPIPKQCDHDWKVLMEECWSHNPAGRPSFTEITNKLQAMSVALQSKRQKRVVRQWVQRPSLV